MRIIFAATGAYGHLYPIVPLAVAARDSGHEVVVATDSQFHPVLAEAGLEAVAAGLTVEAAFGTVLAGLTAPPAGEADVAVEAFAQVLPKRVIADLQPVLRERKFDLMIHEVGNSGAGIVARMAGMPSAVMGLGRVPEGPLWDLMFPALTAVAAEFGVEITDPRTLDEPYIDICPPSLQLPGFAQEVQHLPTRPIAWNPPGSLPPAVLARDRSRPLVYLTLGTAFAQAGLLRHMIDALAELPVDALVATSRAVRIADLGELPDNVTVQQWVPQADLLKHVDLVVHHGGSGTLLGALAQGLAQLMLPLGADQFSNAQLLVGAGVARQVLPDQHSPETIAEQIQGLLADAQARATAGRIAGEISAMPAPAETIERLAGIVG
ncbi:glycosyltransferase [Rugosimonospora acidiphila]|uniref:glycosyltransferase n=1 Tax=Rugosimonospora acidiphila TaxID=556531 RepID=UPI0031EAF74C